MRTHRALPNQHELHRLRWVWRTGSARSRYRPYQTVTQPTGLRGWTLCRVFQTRVPLAAERPTRSFARRQSCAVAVALGCNTGSGVLHHLRHAVPSCDPMCLARTPDMTSLPISYVDGSAEPPKPAMSAHSRRTLLNCPPRPGRCCGAAALRKLAFTVLATSDDVAILTLPHPAPAPLSHAPPAWPAQLLLPRRARCVRGACSPAEHCPSNAPSPASARKPGRLSGATSRWLP